MSVNSKMTAIANQIRTLVGATGTMGLDAMATNLTNANGAMSGIRTQLANKGVTMPTSADILDIATYIGQIESAKVVTGTYANEANFYQMDLRHNLGRTPKGFVILNREAFRDQAANSLYDYVVALYCFDWENINRTFICYSHSYDDSSYTTSAEFVFVTGKWSTADSEHILLSLDDPDDLWGFNRFFYYRGFYDFVVWG